jgi:sarcosine oxidase
MPASIRATAAGSPVYRRAVERSSDVVVIGLGALGSAAVYRAAAAPGSPRVIGLEQFELGHDRGASQDVSRITRRSYHRPEYVRLAIRAQAAWLEVEAAARAAGMLEGPIVSMTGGLDLAPDGAAESIDDYAAAMAEVGVPFEWLDDAAVARRWPQWRLDAGTRALFQAGAGIADPERGNAAHQRLARAAGADLREHARVDAIEDHGGELVVRMADGSRLATGSIVVAADAWTNDLLAPLGSPLPLSVTREQVTWFEVSDEAAYAPGRFPIWIWLDQPSFYGFPTWRGPGPKIGEDVGGRPTTARTRTFDVDLDCFDRVASFAARRLPGLGAAVKTKTCLYTLTPDRDFVLDRLPEHPGVVVALGAAHAYKFAALFGVVLAELALDATRAAPPAELGLFAVDRPVLLGTSTTNLAAEAAANARIALQ